MKLRLFLRSFLWCGNARKNLHYCDQLIHLLYCCLLYAQRFSNTVVNTSQRGRLMLKFSCNMCPEKLHVPHWKKEKKKGKEKKRGSVKQNLNFISFYLMRKRSHIIFTKSISQLSSRHRQLVIPCHFKSEIPRFLHLFLLGVGSTFLISSTAIIPSQHQFNIWKKPVS